MKELTDEQLDWLKKILYLTGVERFKLSHDDSIDMVRHAIAGIVKKAADEVEVKYHIDVDSCIKDSESLNCHSKGLGCSQQAKR